MAKKTAGINYEKLDQLIARHVFGQKLVTATTKKPMTSNGCRVSDRTWVDTGTKSTWGNDVECIADASAEDRVATQIIHNMQDRSFAFSLATSYAIEGGFACVFYKAGGNPEKHHAETLALAVAIAALKALGKYPK